MTDGTKSLEQRRCGSSMRSTPIASCSATIPTNGSLRAEFANTRRGPSVDAACPRGAEGRHASGGRGHSGRGTPPGWGECVSGWSPSHSDRSSRRSRERPRGDSTDRQNWRLSLRGLDTHASSELGERLRKSPAVLVAQLGVRKSPVVKRHPSSAAFVFEYELHLRLEAGPIQAGFGRSHS